MRDTQLAFAVGSGRCGTKALSKLFTGIEHIESHHEYCRDAQQREETLYHLGLLSKAKMLEKLKDIYQSSAYYSDAKIFLDCNHSLYAVIPLLYTLFPDAKFIHLVRDGRKVVSSFYHKLPEQVYHDFGVKTLHNWIDNPQLPMPPPIENFWWHFPPKGTSDFEAFKSYDRFQRICYHWVESNRVIVRYLSGVPQPQQILVRLEDITSSKEKLEKLLNFLAVEYNDSFMALLQKPQHVITPIDYALTKEQHKQFNAIAGTMMDYFGYDGKTKEYEVTY